MTNQNIHPRSLMSKAKVPALILVFIIGLSFLFKDKLFAILRPTAITNNLTEHQLNMMVDRCLGEADRDCLLSAFQRLSEIDPGNISYQANFAFQLTHSKKFDEAQPIYQKILDGGEATYDLMAYYAMNFEGQAQFDEAIKWYEKTLEISPNFVDVTQKLARAYVKRERLLEAISILRSFSDQFPDSQGDVAGDLIADLDLLSRKGLQQSETLRLVGLSRGHFGLPLELSKGAKPEVFLIDTGASVVTVPSKDAQAHFPELMKRSVPVKMSLADGRTIDGAAVTIPVLHLGNWAFKNIRVVYCEKCERLAGMSLLKDLKMEVSSKGSFYTLKLTR
jgi:clan AA aspartic protease (TIGR02281 family)